MSAHEILLLIASASREGSGDFAQTRQSIYYRHTQSMAVDEDSDQHLNIQSHGAFYGFCAYAISIKVWYADSFIMSLCFRHINVPHKAFCQFCSAEQNSHQNYKQHLIHWSRFRIITKHLSQCRRFPTMWYVRPAKPQISLRIGAV